MYSLVTLCKKIQVLLLQAGSLSCSGLHSPGFIQDHVQDCVKQAYLGMTKVCTLKLPQGVSHYQSLFV
jgi:hypothetical protein